MTGVLARLWASVAGPREPSWDEQVRADRIRMEEAWMDWKMRREPEIMAELREHERRIGLECHADEIWPFLYDAPDIALLGPQLPSLAEVERFGEVRHEKEHWHVVRLVDDWRHPETGAPVDWWVTTRAHTYALGQELRQMPRGGPGDNWTLCLRRLCTGDLEIWERP